MPDLPASASQHERDEYHRKTVRTILATVAVVAALVIIGGNVIGAW